MFRFENKHNCILIEGASCFSVIPSIDKNVLVPSVCPPGIVVERLTKETVKLADGPASLLEATNVNVLYKKNLTGNIRDVCTSKFLISSIHENNFIWLSCQRVSSPPNPENVFFRKLVPIIDS